MGMDALDPDRPLSLPAWGAWIEISSLSPQLIAAMSLPAWGAWIEIRRKRNERTDQGSLPAWGAWIEIWPTLIKSRCSRVAPRMGSVD